MELECGAVEPIWYLPNLIALLGVLAVLIWQSIHTTGYERRQRESYQQQLARAEEKCQELRRENEQLRVLLFGAGVRISGTHVDVNVNRDLVGGNVSEAINDKREGT